MQGMMLDWAPVSPYSCTLSSDTPATARPVSACSLHQQLRLARKLLIEKSHTMSYTLAVSTLGSGAMSAGLHACMMVVPADSGACCMRHDGLLLRNKHHRSESPS